MVSEKHKFVFIHVPKTGGNSVHSSLVEYSECAKSYDGVQKDGVDRFGITHEGYSYRKHSPIRVYRRDIGRENIGSHYIFTIIRNPWDWCVSWFFFQRDSKDCSKDEFKAFIKQMPSWRDYVTEEPVWVREVNRVLKQLGINKRLHTKKIDGAVDFFIKFEQLDEGFNKVLADLSLPAMSLPHVNKGNRKAYATYYDDELRQLVATKFKDEIKLGGYEFEEAK